jgi:hypothetical protein
MAGRCFAYISKLGAGIGGQIQGQQKTLVFVAYCCSTADAVYQLQYVGAIGKKYMPKTAWKVAKYETLAFLS